MFERPCYCWGIDFLSHVTTLFTTSMKARQDRLRVAGWMLESVLPVNGSDGFGGQDVVLSRNV